MKPTHEEATASLQQAHDDACKGIGKIKFDKGNVQDLYAVGLYGTLIELSGAMLVLADTQKIIGVPILMRTASEAYVDLKNVLADAEYVHHLEYKRCSQWLRVLDEAADGDNAYLADIHDDVEVLSDRSQIEDQLQQAKDNGGTNLSVRDRFSRASEEDFYTAIYSRLCSESHNDGSALINRHIDLTGDEPMVVVYGNVQKFVMPSLVTLAEMLSNSTKAVHAAYVAEESN